MMCACSLLALALAPRLADANTPTLEADLPYPRSTHQTGKAGEPVYVISEAAISAKADQVTVQTMAGVLARYSPRVYTIKSMSAELSPTTVDDDTSVFWLHDLAEQHGVQFNYTYLTDPRGLIAMFAKREDPEITGFVSYDPSTKSTNAALIRCAASNGVIAAGTASMIDFLGTELGLQAVANLSESTPIEEFVHSKAQLSNRGVVSQPDDGRQSQCMSEYAVFARIPTLEHGRPRRQRAAFQTVLDNFAKDKLNAVYGWTYDEHQFVASANEAGGMVHASDFLYNLGVFSQLPPYVVAQTARERRHLDITAAAVGPSRRNVHTVAFVMSDGDNLQILQNDWMSSKHWNHPHRGQQATSWSYSPAMAQLMPSLLAYVARTATANDSLSTGPSGAGYVYPQLFPETQRRLYAQATGYLMNQSGMTVANVIGVTPSRESVADIAAQPEVDAIVYFTFGVADQGYAGLHGNVAYVNEKPVVALRSCLWGTQDEGDKVGVPGLINELKKLPKDPADPRSYSIIDNQIGNDYEEVVEAARLLAEDGGFDLVLPEELIRRLVANTNRKQQCSLPTGLWADQIDAATHDLPKCWLPRDGSNCVMECNGPNENKRWRCDLDACSNLTFHNNQLLCAETGLACPDSPRPMYV